MSNARPGPQGGPGRTGPIEGWGKSLDSSQIHVFLVFPCIWSSGGCWEALGRRSGEALGGLAQPGGGKRILREKSLDSSQINVFLVFPCIWSSGGPGTLGRRSGETLGGLAQLPRISGPNQPRNSGMQLYTAMYRYIELYTVICSYIKLYTAIYCYLRLHTAICSYIQLYAAIYSYMQLYTAIYRNMQLYTAIYRYIIQLIYSYS